MELKMDFRIAEETLQRLANEKAGIIELSTIVTMTNGLQNHFNELTNAIEPLKAQTVQAQSDLADAQAKLSDALVSIAAARDAAQANAAEITQAATDAAAKLTADAQAQADAIATKAQADTKELQAASIAAVEAMRAEAQKARDSLVAEAADFQTKRDSAQFDYDALQRQIAIARQTIQQMMGA
jgi:peptidoglycan hydrolase CwlO-like protein